MCIMTALEPSQEKIPALCSGNCGEFFNISGPEKCCSDNFTDASSMHGDIMFSAEEQKFMQLEEAYYYESSPNFPSIALSAKKTRTRKSNKNKKDNKRNARNIISSIPNKSSEKKSTIEMKRKETSRNKKASIAMKNNQQQSNRKLNKFGGKKYSSTTSSHDKKKSKSSRKGKRIAKLRAKREKIRALQALFEEEIPKSKAAWINPNSIYEPLSSDYILGAEDLGIHDESMYDRLLDIMDGDDITPEDYDLLLLLDSNNIKSTLTEKDIEEIPVVVIGDHDEHNGENGKALESEGNEINRCEICLEEWTAYAEVRKLPCGHMFCKECIDHWLTNESQKCPNLSCYWSKEEDAGWI